MPNKTKNICLIIDTLNGGGAERVVINLATELTKLGHRADIIILSNQIEYIIENKKINIHCIKNSKKKSNIVSSNTGLIKQIKKIPIIRNSLRLLVHLIKYILRDGFIIKKKSQALLDKITSLNIDFDLFISNLATSDKCCITAKLPNLYCCIHRGISEEINLFNENKLFYKIMQISFQKTYKNQNLIGVSDGVAKAILDFGIKPKSLQTIYNLLDFVEIKKQAQKHLVDEKDYIICVGRLHKEKNHNMLINAYKQANIKQKLLIFGKGVELDNIKTLINQLNLQDKVIVKGFSHNPYPYIKNAKALVLSSNMEGLPTVLLEALFLGVPVVSTNCPHGPSEILVDELADFLSPVSDVNALAKNIAKMMKNPVKIDERYTKKFTKEEVVNKYLSLCK